jgi:predicted amidophosphoribosyltransferase
MGDPRVVLARLLAPPLCWGCGGPARRDERLCLGCRRTLRHLAREPVDLAGVAAWAPLAYEGAARELVRGLKFRGAMALADPMAALIVANAPEEFLPRAGDRAEGDRAGGDRAARDHAGGDRAAAEVKAAAGDRLDRRPPALVPIPLHPARRRRRGFNQAAVLAKALARRTGLAVADSLTRSGTAGTQVGRPRRERLATPPGRIRAEGYVPARVILVDDVATTGATLAACARALRAAGALEVRAVTFARTLGR